ncbi:unnamed protein product [Allacma fusca]|uniref:Uncharacterized protein n=1 Tax=Allacma fusca TaxID=39272 RepID=A0A8J2NXX6_9HEXA|nr:unnamed protein product [Allacma fusca]
MAPSQVNEKNEVAVYFSLYGNDDRGLKKPPKPKFNIGDSVLLNRQKHPFVKGYAYTYNPEVFTIHKVSDTNPRMNYLKDKKGEEIWDGAYQQDIQKSANQKLGTLLREICIREVRTLGSLDSGTQ